MDYYSVLGAAGKGTRGLAPGLTDVVYSCRGHETVRASLGFQIRFSLLANFQGTEMTLVQNPGEVKSAPQVSLPLWLALVTRTHSSCNILKL